MLRYLSLRVLYTLPVIWLVVSLVFLLIHLVPGDPVLQMLGEGAPAADVQMPRWVSSTSTIGGACFTAISARP
jgi:ABC-type dipeptide/oligopeptide/nickel transport system permease component